MGHVHLALTYVCRIVRVVFVFAGTGGGKRAGVRQGKEALQPGERGVLARRSSERWYGPPVLVASRTNFFKNSTAYSSRGLVEKHSPPISKALQDVLSLRLFD